jgi:hypothetical protein
MKYNWRILLGVGLLLLGVLSLLQSLNILVSGAFTALMFALLFASVGITFLAVLARGRQNWWAAIPGCVMLGLAFTILLGEFGSPALQRLGGPLFLASISAAFWVVYYLVPSNWWAIIPGGVLATLAVVAAVPNAADDFTGSLFFLGLAATFGLLWLLPVQGKRMTWPIYPAAALGIMAIVVLLSQSNLVGYIWPLILIGTGIILVFRALVRR